VEGLRWKGLQISAVEGLRWKGYRFVAARKVPSSGTLAMGAGNRHANLERRGFGIRACCERTAASVSAPFGLCRLMVGTSAQQGAVDWSRACWKCYQSGHWHTECPSALFSPAFETFALGRASRGVPLFVRPYAARRARVDELGMSDINAATPAVLRWSAV